MIATFFLGFALDTAIQVGWCLFKRQPVQWNPIQSALCGGILCALKGAGL